MNRLLRRSRDQKRLKNLRRFSLLTLLLVMSMLLVDLGSDYSYASNSQSSNSMAIIEKAYGVGMDVVAEKRIPKVVEIITADLSGKYLVYSDKPKDVLEEAGFTVDYHDLILPEDLTSVTNGSTLQVVKVEIDLITKIEEAPFQTVQVETTDLAYGSSEVAQEGVLGVMEKKIRVIYEDGKAVKSEVVETNYLKEPVQKVINIGRKPIGIRSCGYWGEIIDEITKDEKQRSWMKFVMFWESGCYSGSISKPTGTYKGLFQFSPDTFRRFGGRDSDIFNGIEQIKIVDKMYRGYKGSSSSLRHQWPKAHEAYVKKYGW